MKAHDIIGALGQLAEAKGWHFMAGDNWYLNYQADLNTYEGGQLVLIANFNSQLVYSKARKLSQIVYSGTLMIGRKFETNFPVTESSLSETWMQKYCNRLFDLTTNLDEFISEFACANELTIGNCQFKYDLNKFDANIDFTAATITITDEL